jgi:hypothetical protein
MEQNGTISFQNGTAPRSTPPGSHQGDEVDSLLSADLEQNGTISFQNGTTHRSTTTGSHRGDEVDSLQSADLEQNGTTKPPESSPRNLAVYGQKLQCQKFTKTTAETHHLSSKHSPSVGH